MARVAPECVAVGVMFCGLVTRKYYIEFDGGWLLYQFHLWLWEAKVMSLSAMSPMVEEHHLKLIPRRIDRKCHD